MKTSLSRHNNPHIHCAVLSAKLPMPSAKLKNTGYALYASSMVQLSIIAFFLSQIMLD